jgi:hypothetical protein
MEWTSANNSSTASDKNIYKGILEVMAKIKKMRAEEPPSPFNMNRPMMLHAADITAEQAIGVREKMIASEGCGNPAFSRFAMMEIRKCSALEPGTLAFMETEYPKVEWGGPVKKFTEDARWSIPKFGYTCKRRRNGVLHRQRKRKTSMKIFNSFPGPIIPPNPIVNFC